MGLEQIYYVSGIVAAFAVVGSLVYLGIQVRQSNALSRAQTRQSMMELTQEQLLLQVSDPTIWIGVFNEGQRSLEEKVKTNMWLTLFMRQREYDWLTRKEGIVDPMFGAYTGVIAMILGTERNRRWWSLRRDINEFNPEFMRHVDDILARSPLTNYPQMIKAWD
jgi:hypothetical protein